MDRSIPEMRVGYAEILAFVVLVLGLAWTGFLPPMLDRVGGVSVPASLEAALTAVAILSPVGAAAVLVATRSRTETVGTFLASRLRWRVSPGWYVFALLLFPLLFAGPVAAYVVWTGELPPIDAAALLLVVDVFTLGVVANLIETYGWRGYLQEGLQSMHSAFAASLAVGVVWGLWHAPLFLVADAPLADLPYGRYVTLLVGLSVIFGWVYNETGGSVAVVTLLHCGQNATVAPVLFGLVDTGVDVAPLLTLYTIVVWLVVAALYVRTNPGTLTGIQSPGS